MPDEIRPGIRRLFSLAVHREDLARKQMDDELRFHLEARVEQLVRSGMTPTEAREEAMRRITATNNLHTARERLQHSAGRRERKMAWHERLTELAQDTKYAARGLMNRPAFTAIAVITLAVGIGANTAILSAVNALLLRPLPLREPERLMEIDQTGPGGGSGPDN